MAWNKGKIIVLALAALIVAVGVAVLVGRREAERGVVRLADGTEVKVQQVTFGKKHRLVYGSWWEQMLQRMPTNVTARFGVRPAAIDFTKEDTLVVWIEWRNGTNKSRFPNWLGIGDSNGLAACPEYTQRNIYRSNNVTLASFQFRSFPRNEKMLSLELSAPDPPPSKSNERKHVANFRAGNPAFAAKPAANLKIWPTTTTADGEEFTLVGINTGLSTTGVLAGRSWNRDWTEVVFRVGTNEPAQLTTNVQEHGDWVIERMEMMDGFGNVIGSSWDGPAKNLIGRVIPMPNERVMMRRDDGVALIPGAIWPNETWNVQAVFERSAKPSMDAAHRWSTTIRVPEADQKISLNQTGRVEGCQIELESIERSGASAPMLSVHFTAKTAGSTLRVLRIEDQRGTNIVFRAPTKAEPRFEVRAGPESTNLHFTFGIIHPVVVEVSGRASILRTNIEHWGNQSKQ